MSTPAPLSPSPPPARRGSYGRTFALVLLLVAAAGGYYLYVVGQNPDPPPPDEFAALRGYFRQLAGGDKLAAGYVDADGDLVADPPAAPAKSPDEIGFTVVGTDDPARLEAEQAEWKDFMAAVEKATGKKVVYRADVPGPSAQMDALRAGRLQVTAFNTGAVPAAAATAGFVPLFAPADKGGHFSYRMEILVRADDPARTAADLRGRSVGFVGLSSNSGAKAPMVALKEKFGLLPGRDYRFKFTGDHYRSLADLATGRYDAVCVASDLKERALAAGSVTADGREVPVLADSFRAVYVSDPFPPLCFGVPHDLPADLRAKVEAAFRGFRFEGTSVGKRFVPQGKVRFAPVRYAADWKYVREVDATLASFADLP